MRPARPLWLLFSVLLCGAARRADAAPSLNVYAGSTSLSPGDSLSLYASSTASPLTLRIFRDGAAQETLFTVTGLACANVPVPDSAFVKGCNWPLLTTLAIPASWRSGFYEAQLTPASGGTLAGSVPFVVRGDPAAPKPLLVLSASNTAHAYNAFGGKSLYEYNSSGGIRASKVSFLRPYDTNFGLGQYFKYELPFVHWLERSGFTADFATDVDLATNPALLSGHRCVVFVGHDEYWTPSMYDAVESFQDTSGNVAIFGGNTCFWAARYENHATLLTCYKSTTDPMYPAHPESTTVNWRSVILNRPECIPFGVMTPSCESTVSTQLLFNRTFLWLTRGLESQVGNYFGSTELGYEFDTYISSYSPENAFVLFATWVPGTCPQIAASVYFEKDDLYSWRFQPGGGGVFTAGTLQWPWGLDSTAVGGPADPRIQQLSGNVLTGLARRLVAPLPTTVVVRAALAGGGSVAAESLSVTATGTAYDVSSLPPVLMADDGVWPDSVAGDGIFTARITVPTGQRLPMELHYNVAAGPLCTAATHDLVWLEDTTFVRGCQWQSVDSVVACGAVSGLVSGMPRPMRLAVSPNPARGAQFIRWGQGGAFRLVTLYDTGGRRVRVMRLASSATGAAWDGRSDAGGVVAAGVYLARAEGPAGSLTTRLVRLR